MASRGKNRKSWGSRGPCSYCARDGRHVIHDRGRKPRNPSCKGRGALALK